MKTVMTWSHKHQRGMIRFAVLMSACFGACLLCLVYHPLHASIAPSAPKPVLRQSQSGTQKDCGCSGGTGVAGYAYDGAHKHLRLVDTAAENGSGINPDKSANAPRTPSLYAVIVAPNQQLPLATTSPLPLGDRPPGDNRPGGFWTAEYGKISPDGKRYTAPAVVPPLGGIDVVEYTSVGNTSPIIPDTITLTIVVRDPKNLSKSSLFPCLKTLALPLIKIDQEGQAKGLSHNQATQTVAWTGQVDKNLSRNVESVSSKPVMGYLLPSWSYYGRVQVYVPSVDPASGLQLSGQKVCRRGPLSGPPPEPAANYPVTNPGGPRYYKDTFTAPPEVVKIGTTGWTTITSAKFTLSASQIDAINLAYKGQGGSASFNLTVGMEWTTGVRSMTNRFNNRYFIDHWTVTPAKAWKWAGEDELYQEGIGNIYSPAWYSVFDGYPPDGAPRWNPTWLTKVLGMP